MKPLLHELRLALVALQFLTRVPIPAWVGYRDEWLQACVRYFPLVGTLVGGLGALALGATAMLWPWPVAVLLSMVATLVLTGAFHEDGLADTFDALGGVVAREKALEIMKDSRVGTYGAVALMATLALKALLLTALGAASAGMALIVAHTLSRTLPVLLIRTLPYAGDRQWAKAKPLATSVRGVAVLVALAWAALVVAGAGAAGCFEWMALAAAVLAIAAVFALMHRWLRLRLGGFTGDTLGAAQQLAEVAVYLALLAVVQARA